MTPRTRALSAALALVASAAIALSPAVATAQTSSIDPQTSSQLIEQFPSPGLVQRSFTQGAHHREYTVALPASFNPFRSYPIVLGFGGYTDTADSFRGYAGLEGATGGEAIVVYAQGVNNAWAGAPYSTTTLAEDIEYTRFAVNDVAANFSGDAGRVYATGLSNGGGFAAALSCHAPELVDAVASVAGAYYDPTVTGCSYAAQVPTLLMHGTADGLVAYEGGYRHNAHYMGVESALAGFAARNGCTVGALNPSWEDAGSTTLRPGSCATATQIVRVEGAGHTWFNAPAAESVAWDFFRANG